MFKLLVTLYKLGLMSESEVSNYHEDEHEKVSAFLYALDNLKITSDMSNDKKKYVCEYKLHEVHTGYEDGWEL